MTKKTFKANIDDEAETSENRSERFESDEASDADVSNNSIENLQEQLEEVIKSNQVMNREVLDEIADVFFKHERVLQTMTHDRDLAIIYEGYSVGPLEDVLLSSGKFKYAGTFAARTPEETGATYRLTA